MRSRRVFLFFLFILVSAAAPFSGSAGAQVESRIWGRVTTVDGDTFEGFIRWDRNEGSWVDLLEGSKETTPFQFQNWWKMTHPGDQHRDRVVELAGYRITWDDDEPDFPSSVESGIRFGHLRKLTVEGNEALLVLRSGEEVILSGGATDLGRDLREVLVFPPGGRVVELEWEDLRAIEFGPAPARSSEAGRRLHGTIERRDAPPFTGYIAWDLNKILTTDTLEGAGLDGRDREILFGTIARVSPGEDSSRIVLKNGEALVLSGGEDVTDRNDGIQVSDPYLGQVGLDWGDVREVRFHEPEFLVGWGDFDGSKRLRGTVFTVDSTEVSGWVRWDGDEEFAWELLDGREDGVEFDIEFGMISAIERHFKPLTSLNIGPTGMSVGHSREEGARVTLRDGRTFDLGDSNDVDERNHGIFLLTEESGRLPDDEEAEWVMVSWEDFLSVRFDWEVGP